MHRAAAVVAVFAVGVVVSCTDRQPAAKTGVSTTVLKVVNHDAVDPNRQSPAARVFLEQLVALSGGRLKVAVDSHFENGEPTAESDVVAAVVDGRYDLAWPTTRAFTAAGITSLQALEVPFLLTSVEAERAVVTSDVAADFLATLSRHGLVGLGLAVGPLRRPMATMPLVGVPDWRGVRFRTYNSPVQAAAVQALGATSVTRSFQFAGLVTAGELDGVEIDLAQYDENGLGALLPHATRNVALWAKIFVFTMNKASFERLSDEQRGWVQAAAQRAVRASVDFSYDESTPAQTLCRAGVRFHDASKADLAALQLAIRPVRDKIAADPVSGPLLEAVESTVDRHPGGRVPDVPEVPAECLR